MLREQSNLPITNAINGVNITETELEKKALTVNSPKEYIVELVDRKIIKDFIEKWHYSHNINGLISDYCFALYYLDAIENKKVMIGALIYGSFGMANVWKNYAENSSDVIELRRLALINSTVRNSESFFIGKSLQWLKKNTTLKKVISYSDLYYGHEGIIYKASNFTKIGETSKGRLINCNGKLYHDKAIRTKYKGELKPFAKRLKIALENGEAFYVNTPPKNIYQYVLKN